MQRAPLYTRRHGHDLGRQRRGDARQGVDAAARDDQVYAAPLGGLLARVIAALVDAHLEPVLLPQVDRQEAPHQAAAHHGGRPGGIMIQERGH